jgi:hypothetical protein
MLPPLPASQPPAEIRETHSAVITMMGDHAVKVKKPVDLGFLDFRSLSARQRAIDSELKLNRRMAPDVYLDATTLRSSRGGVLEHLLIMRRMPEVRRLSALVRNTAVTTNDLQHQLNGVARLLTNFHWTARRSREISAEAGAVGLRRRWTDNLDEVEPHVVGTAWEKTRLRIAQLTFEYIDGRTDLFARRDADRLFVDGHGDSGADDVFCLDDGPRILDCIDFDDRLRWLDVLDDAAFLAMELEHLGRADLARYFLDRYLEFSAAKSVSSLAHHYLAYRAFVRAKVALLRPATRGLVDGYVGMTVRHLEAGRVSLIVVGGAPGVGKSTIAARLADRLGAVPFSTDTIRRQIAPAGGEKYSEQSRDHVYRSLLANAERALSVGETVVADATWPRAQLRQLARDCAVRTHSRLIELECRAPIELSAIQAQRRLESGASVSDAGGAVARRLAEGRDAWPSAAPVNCSGSPEEALNDIVALLPDAREAPTRETVTSATVG